MHATYYLAIERMDIGVALVIQYLAPALLLIWAAVVHRVHAPKRLWAAVALSVAGCALVVDAPAGTGNLDGLGVLAAIAAMVTLAIYLTASQRAGSATTRSPRWPTGSGSRRCSGSSSSPPGRSRGTCWTPPATSRWRWAWP